MCKSGLVEMSIQSCVAGNQLDAKGKLILAMRELAGFGKKDGIAFVEKLPGVICSGVSQDTSTGIMKFLQKQGAAVVLRSS